MSFNPGGNGFEQQGQGGRNSDDEDDSTDNESSQSGADSERQFLSSEEQDQLRRNIEQSESDALDRIGPGRSTLTPREGESGGAPGANAGEEDIINNSDTAVPETGTGPNTLTPEGGQSGGDVPEGTGEDIVNSGSSDQSQQTTPDEGAFDDGLNVDPDTISSDESGQTSTQTGSGSTEAATESQTGGTVDVPEDPVRTDDSFDPDPQTGQETARAPRGPDGDVESPTEAARRRDRERGDIGDFAVENPFTGNRLEEDLKSASQDFSDATTFKDVPGPAGNFLSGASQAVNVPGIALGAKEGVEAALFTARNVDDPGKVFDVAVGETVATSDRTAEAAQDRPAETAGALTGGIIAGTAATRTARRASLPTGSRTSTSSLRRGERGQLDLGESSDTDTPEITADDLAEQRATTMPDQRTSFGDGQTGPSVSGSNFEDSGRIVRQGDRQDFGDPTFSDRDVSSTIDIDSGPSSVSELRRQQLNRRMNVAFGAGTSAAAASASDAIDTDLPLPEDADDPLDNSVERTIDPTAQPTLDPTGGAGDFVDQLPRTIGPGIRPGQEPRITPGGSQVTEPDDDTGIGQTPDIGAGTTPGTDTDTTVTPDDDTDTTITPGSDTDTTVTTTPDSDTSVTTDTDTTPTPNPSPTPTPTRPADSDPDKPRRPRRFPFLDDEDKEDNESAQAFDVFEEAFGSGIGDVDLEDL